MTLGATQRRLARLIATAIGGALCAWMGPLAPARAQLAPPPAVMPAPPPDPGDAPAPSGTPVVFCPVCGAQNRAGSRFCLKDGAPLRAIDPTRFEPDFARDPETYSPEEIQQAVHRASQSLVRVRVKTTVSLKYPVAGKTGRIGWLESVEEEARLVGSGFAVGGAGEIVTNAHVADPFGTQAEIAVDTQSPQSYHARVVGVDHASDLALLKVETGSLPPLSWADSNALRLGDETWAIGYPLNVGLTATRGTISSLGRMRTGMNQVENFLHSDAFITHGNSGGPLVDVTGRVVGVSDMGFHQAKGQGYSIPSAMARYVTDRLRKFGKYERGFLGLHVRPVDAESVRKYGLKRTAGVVVESVLEGSPGERAGFKPGDVLFGINGRQAVSSYLIQEAISSVGPGAALRIALDRGGQVLEVPVTTALRPQEARIDPLVDLASSLMVRFEEDPKGKGVLVRIPDPFSPALQYRLTDGVRIEEVLPARDWSDKADLDRAPAKPAPVGTIQDLRQALQRAYLGGLIGVTFYLDRSEDRVTSVVLDETWAIVL